MARRSAKDLELLKRALRKSVLAGSAKPKRKGREREDEEDGGEEDGDPPPRRPAPARQEKVEKPKGYADAVTPKR